MVFQLFWPHDAIKYNYALELQLWSRLAPQIVETALRVDYGIEEAPSSQGLVGA